MLQEKNLMDLYMRMLRIRMVEDEIAVKYNEREMHTPIHLYSGQEAVAVGVCSCLEKEDKVFSNHRCHGHYLAKGGNLKKLICELYNKREGCSKGKGGSMHITDIEAGFPVSSAIVAGQVPVATGAALAMKIKRTGNIAVVFFGDGATEEGVVYESICFAKLKKLPILFVCEDNKYAVSSSFADREPLERVSDKFQAIICAERVDGNDVIAVQNMVKRYIDDIRKNQNPVFLECSTYRYRHHHNITTGVELEYRSQEEWDKWKERDPILMLENYLLEKGILQKKEKDKIIKGINNEIETAFSFARKSKLPECSDLIEGVWG